MTPYLIANRPYSSSFLDVLFLWQPSKEKVPKRKISASDASAKIDGIFNPRRPNRTAPRARIVSYAFGCARGLLADASAIEDALILNADPSNAEEECRNAPMGRPGLTGLHD